jgi:hypothetical protein
MRWQGNVTYIAENKNLYNILAWYSEGDRPHVEDVDVRITCIKLEFREVRWEDMEWLHLAQDTN